MRLQLLGSPRWHDRDTVLDIPPKQALLLGAYLAYKEDWASRDELLILFWPDEDEKTARHNLSQLLYHCKKQAWMNGLETERNRVRWLVDTDVKQFREAIGNGKWQDATTHSGALLETIPTDYATSFEAWLDQEREALNTAWREAVLKHTAALVAADQPAEAARLLRKVLNQEPLAEDILQAYMHATHADGQRDIALKAYETFNQQLTTELGLPPLKSTQQLAETIRRGQASVQTQNEPDQSSTRPFVRNFPASLTPFIGRALELAELSRLFTEARLVTLLGSGGMGKSRLATEFAREQISFFRDGAVFVELASLTDANLIPARILAALELTPGTEQDPYTQLLDSVKDQELLLVLDNFEHLLDGSGLVVELLEASAHSKILVTSREALDFQGEYIYDLGGLSYPSTDLMNVSVTQPENYDAVTLFLRSARRTNPMFSLTSSNKKATLAICSLLRGAPLALELAASWVRLLSPQEITAELSRNLDLLSSHKDVPERHRSMRAVFEHSWALLSDAEQDALARLAVFRGGFTKDSAKAVTDTSLRTLLSLVNKSLLQRTQTGRFERHLVVQQFSQEKLEQSTKQLKACQEQHHTYCLNFINDANGQLVGEKQLDTLNAIDAESANFDVALNWSYHQKKAEPALHLAASLGRYWELRGHYTQGKDWLVKTLLLSRQSADDSSLIEHRAKALNGLGNIARLKGEFQEAREAFEESLSIYRRLDWPESIATTLNNLSLVLTSQGDYQHAKELLNESLRLYRQESDEQGVAMALNNLSIVAFWYGNYPEAQTLLEECLPIVKGLQDTYGAASILNNLGNALRMQGLFEDAKKCQQESLTYFRELKGKHGVAQTLNNLGLIALEQSQFNKAEQYFQESLTLSQDMGEEQVGAGALTNLGLVALDSGDMDTAQRYFEQALTIFKQHKNHLGIAITLNRQGVLALQMKDYGLATDLQAESLSLFESLHDKSGQADALTQLSLLASHQTDHQRATKLAQQSLMIYHTSNNRKGFAEALEAIACIQSTQHPERTVSLWAAAEQIRQAIGSSRSNLEATEYLSRLERVRQHLEPKAFKSAWSRGTTASYQQLLSLALENIEIAAIPLTDSTDKPSVNH